MRAGLSYVCLSFVVAVLLPSSLHGTGVHFMKGGQRATGSKSSCTPSRLGSVARTHTAEQGAHSQFCSKVNCGICAGLCRMIQGYFYL